MFYDMGASSARHEDRAKVERAHYEADTPKRAQLECTGLARTAQLECITKIVDSQRENRRDESDLAAQWKAADWVMWATILAGIQVIATLLGLYYVKRTLDATLEAVEDTGKATKAMERQNDIARDIAHSQLRPYIYVSDGTIRIHRIHDIQFISDDIEFFINIKNFGQTPAKKVVVHIRGMVIDYDDFDHPKVFEESDTRVFGDMPPGFEEFTQPQTVSGIQAAHDSLNGETKCIMIDGRIVYEDSQGTSYRTEFRRVCVGHSYRESILGIGFNGNTST